ncbi:MAG: glycyl-radical enzyme activating protein [Christensenella sp.]|nr:glycyl-radical enzyme activating protein [Christensenella sp.]
MKEKGVIFNIQKYSVNDGGGIRTIIFLKGCPLRCVWCSNPESQIIAPQVLFTATKCIGCGKCAVVCPNNALNNPVVCTGCGKCVDVCYAGAREIYGKEMTVQQVLAEIEKDRVFYRNSGGGVTLSGGEALMQWEFASALASAVKKRYLNLAIETTGYAPFERAYEVLKFCDTILYDLKHMDSAIHQKYTGVSNALILDNARKLSELGKKVIYRIPLIGGINNDEINIRSVIDFAKETHVSTIHLLPYHEFGRAKYEKIGKRYACEAYTPSDEQVQNIKEMMQKERLNVKIGG